MYERIGQNIGQVAIKGYVKLLLSATMILLNSNEIVPAEVAMARLHEVALRRLIQGGETTTVEFKIAVPRPVEMAERLCGMANAQGGFIIVGVEDIDLSIVGVPNDRIALTTDVIISAVVAKA